MGGSLMGYRLVKEVMDNAPRMALAEWKAMVVLAEDANDASRLTWSPTTSDKIIRRLDLTPHAWANLRGTLVRKGLLEVAEAGRKGRCAKYRFPEWPQIRPQAEDESEDIRPRLEDESTPIHPQVEDESESLGPRVEDESAPIRPRAEDARPKYVLQEVTPTHQNNSSEQRTHQTSLSAAAREAAPAAVVASEREKRQGQIEGQPRGRQQQPVPEDVSDAYAAARAAIGKPATPSERVRIRASVVELIREGQSIEYLIRLAAWMGTEHPGWTDLARARTAEGSPALIPRQRTDGHDQPCQDGECDGHDHAPCKRGWIELPNGLAHCPCSPMSKLRLATAAHETYRDPDASAYRAPKGGHVGWQNPTDPNAYDGEF